MLKYDLYRAERGSSAGKSRRRMLDSNVRTADIKQESDGCKLVDCSEMGQIVADIESAIEIPAAVTV